MLPRNRISGTLKRKLILNLLGDRGEMSIRQLEVETGMRQSSVTQVVNQMLTEKLIVKRAVGTDEARGFKVIMKGRKAKPPSNVYGIYKEPQS